MTLSNFDWTDKASVRWFIMLPTGHEGPYSLDALSEKLEKKLLSQKSAIWAEGLSGSITLEEAINNSFEANEPPPHFGLPPLPDEELPPLPVETFSEVQEVVPASRGKAYFVLTTLFLALILGGGYQWMRSSESFEINRHSKMSMSLYSRIQKDFRFEGWNKKLFFKEYVPADLSHIWLVSSGFQNCDVEASFKSMDDKLITLGEGPVAFKTKDKLRDHVVEFSSFEFDSGNKVLPGMYEMEVKASACEWDGLAAKIGNFFKAPESEYTGKMNVILYAKGPKEFYTLLDKLIRKKMQIEIKNQDQESLFWQGIQEKLQTLMAISLQIEQLLLDFVSKNPDQFSENLKPTVDAYTQNFGQFLTNFVVSNENDFQQLSVSGLKGISKKKNYEMVLRSMAQRIGYESMKFIENFQSLKKPTQTQISSFEPKIRATFKGIKSEINQKIIQVSDDRSLAQETTALPENPSP